MNKFDKAISELKDLHVLIDEGNLPYSLMNVRNKAIVIIRNYSDDGLLKQFDRLTIFKKDTPSKIRVQKLIMALGIVEQDLQVKKENHEQQGLIAKAFHGIVLFLLIVTTSYLITNYSVINFVLNTSQIIVLAIAFLSLVLIYFTKKGISIWLELVAGIILILMEYILNKRLP